MLGYPRVWSWSLTTGKKALNVLFPMDRSLMSRPPPPRSPPHFLRPLTHIAVDGTRRLALASYHNGYDMRWGGKAHVYALQLGRKSDLCCWKDLATLLPFGFIKSFFASEKAWSDVWEAGTEMLSLRFDVMTPGQVLCLWGMEKIPAMYWHCVNTLWSIHCQRYS